MPNTFAGSPITDVENTSTAVPYAMVRDSLQYGIWLHDDAVAHFKPNGAQFEMTAYGNFPTIIIESRGTPAALTTQSAVSSGLPRGVAGFNQFHLGLMDQSMTKSLDTYSGFSNDKLQGTLKITPNPSSNFIRFEGLETGTYRLRIFNSNGMLLRSTEINPSQHIDISSLRKGLYVISLNRKWARRWFLNS